MKFILKTLENLKSQLSEIQQRLKTEAISESNTFQAESLEAEKTVVTLVGLLDRLIKVLTCSWTHSMIYEVKVFSDFWQANEDQIVAIFFKEAPVYWHCSSVSPLGRVIRFEHPTYLLSPEGLYYITPYNHLCEPISASHCVSTDPKLIATLKDIVLDEVELVQNKIKKLKEHVLKVHPACLPLVNNEHQEQIFHCFQHFLKTLAENSFSVVEELEVFGGQFYLVQELLNKTLALDDLAQQGENHRKQLLKQKKGAVLEQALDRQAWLKAHGTVYPQWLQTGIAALMLSNPRLEEVAKPLRESAHSFLLTPDPQALKILKRAPEDLWIDAVLKVLPALLNHPEQSNLLQKINTFLSCFLKTSDPEQAEQASLALLGLFFQQKEIEHLQKSLRELFDLAPDNANKEIAAFNELLLPLCEKEESRNIVLEFIKLWKSCKGKDFLAFISPGASGASKRLVGLREAILKCDSYLPFIQSLQEAFSLILPREEAYLLCQAVQEYSLLYSSLMAKPFSFDKACLENKEKPRSIIIQAESTQLKVNSELSGTEAASVAKAEQEGLAQQEEESRVSRELEKAKKNLAGVFYLALLNKPGKEKAKQSLAWLLKEGSVLAQSFLQAEVQNYYLRFQEKEQYNIRSLLRRLPQWRNEENEAEFNLESLTVREKQLLQNQERLNFIKSQLGQLKKKRKYPVNEQFDPFKRIIQAEQEQAETQIQRQIEACIKLHERLKTEIRNYLASNLEAAAGKLRSLSGELKRSQEALAETQGELSELAPLLEKDSETARAKLLEFKKALALKQTQAQKKRSHDETVSRRSSEQESLKGLFGSWWEKLNSEWKMNEKPEQAKQQAKINRELVKKSAEESLRTFLRQTRASVNALKQKEKEQLSAQRKIKKEFQLTLEAFKSAISERLQSIQTILVSQEEALKGLTEKTTNIALELEGEMSIGYSRHMTYACTVQFNRLRDEIKHSETNFNAFAVYATEHQAYLTMEAQTMLRSVQERLRHCKIQLGLEKPSLPSQAQAAPGLQVEPQSELQLPLEQTSQSEEKRPLMTSSLLFWKRHYLELEVKQRTRQHYLLSVKNQINHFLEKNREIQKSFSMSFFRYVYSYFWAPRPEDRLSQFLQNEYLAALSGAQDQTLARLTKQALQDFSPDHFQNKPHFLALYILFQEVQKQFPILKVENDVGAQSLGVMFT